MDTLDRLAKPLYKPVGQNSWEHISQVLERGDAIAQANFGRHLTDLERATLLFHDCAVLSRQTKDEHAKYSAQLARKILAKQFNKKQLNEISTAIAEHDPDGPAYGHFSSPTGELLASADFNPPSLPWIANKSYVWGITHGLTKDERYANAMENMKRVYSSKGSAVYPDMYMKVNRDKVRKMQKDIDALTLKRMKRIVDSYRRKRGMSDNDVSLG